MVFITIIAYLIVNVITLFFGAFYWLSKPKGELSKKVWFWVGLGLSLINVVFGGFLGLLFIGLFMGISELTGGSASDYDVVFRWLSGFTGLTWIGWIAGAVKFMKTPIWPVVEIIKMKE